MRLSAVATLLVLSVPGLAHAHDATTLGSSEAVLPTLAVCVVAGWYAMGLARQRRQRRPVHGPRPRDLGLFAVALGSAALALIWPLEAWAAYSFAAHMVQHMILITVTAPLVVAARPLPVLLAAIGRTAGVPMARGVAGLLGLRRARLTLLTATALFALSIWGWHLPAAFRYALTNEMAHIAQHATLLAAALYFWHAIRQAAASDRRLAAVAALLVTLIHSGLLGGLITFAQRPLYAAGAFSSDVSSTVADQQLAGLIMWVPACAIYIAAALWLLNGVIVRTEEHGQRRVDVVPRARAS